MATTSATKLKITAVEASGAVSTLSINSNGEGYNVGDIVGIVTAQASGAKGQGAQLVIKSVGNVRRHNHFPFWVC